MDKNYPRWQSEIVKQALLSRRVIVLAGARKCGKTTLAKNLELPGAIYRTLDDVTLLESAREIQATLPNFLEWAYFRRFMWHR